MGYIAKTELLHELYKVGEGKANIKNSRLIILGLFAGMFIALSGYSYIIINPGMASINPMYAKFISGICFTFGLFAVVVSGGDLFTGNVLMIAPMLAKRISGKQVLKNWSIVYITNFLGAILVSILVYIASSTSPETFEYLHKITLSKTTAPFVALVFKGIGCNFFVCIGVWMSYAAKDIVSKFFTCLMAVVLFILCGFEHSIANMFYLTLSYIVSDVSISGVLYDLIPVTIGNIIGGSIVAVGYYYSYRD